MSSRTLDPQVPEGFTTIQVVEMLGLPEGSSQVTQIAKKIGIHAHQKARVIGEDGKLKNSYTYWWTMEQIEQIRAELTKRKKTTKQPDQDPPAWARSIMERLERLEGNTAPLSAPLHPNH